MMVVVVQVTKMRIRSPLASYTQYVTCCGFNCEGVQIQYNVLYFTFAWSDYMQFDSDDATYIIDLFHPLYSRSPRLCQK